MQRLDTANHHTIALTHYFHRLKDYHDIRDGNLNRDDESGQHVPSTAWRWEAMYAMSEGKLTSKQSCEIVSTSISSTQEVSVSSKSDIAAPKHSLIRIGTITTWLTSR
jgi:hypothetical protein